MNKVFLVGNVGKIETKQINDKTLTTFSLATSEAWTDRDGKKQERVEWHNCIVWGKLADYIGKNIGVGAQLTFVGKLQTRSYENKTGGKTYRTEIHVVSDFKAMTYGKKTEPQKEQPQEPQNFGDEPHFDPDEELPF